MGWLRQNAVALLALFVALGGVGYAAAVPRNSVGTKQVQPESLRGKDIDEGSLNPQRVYTVKREGAAGDGEFQVSCDPGDVALGAEFFKHPDANVHISARFSTEAWTFDWNGPPGAWFTGGVSCLDYK
jgi:hypothetical protein